MSIITTQKAIKRIKHVFEKTLARNLDIMRVSAPRFIKVNTGIQDDLANTCTSVKFHIPDCSSDVEIVHSLAKWKRIALNKYNINIHKGIYTDMDAIRKDEKLDFMHSAYVDQWDWEININEEDRTEEFLKCTVNKIYNAIRKTAAIITCEFDVKINLPEKITFIHSEELEEKYPDKSPKERENIITKEKGAVFIIGIGYPLTNGEPHDIRAVDYDDWSKENGRYHGLNGDILVWNDATNCAFELSSMGIRVDTNALQTQANIMSVPINTTYHEMVINKTIPFSIGGGIGQSRLCMYLLYKRHIGEVQASEWPIKMVEECWEKGIHLL